MKLMKSCSLFFAALLIAMYLSSCASKQQHQQTAESLDAGETPSGQQQSTATARPTNQLPVQYQNASYVVADQAAEEMEIASQGAIKVGARIRSTQGPQPLWDIVKRLANLKDMNVSWASDVDRNVLVDVDIGANDDFFEALDSMLRQVDYFHEMQGSTIVIRYRETRQYHIAMPFTAQQYTTLTGGDVLGSSDNAGDVSGLIQLGSEGNVFDVWENISKNLDTIIEVWDAQKSSVAVTEDTDELTATATTSVVQDPRSFYLIDKPVGIITVTAPRILLTRIDAYMERLKKTLYRQISIEAKIIEVQLNDSSSIGINWSDALTGLINNFAVSGVINYGYGGQVYPFVFSDDRVWGDDSYIVNPDGSYTGNYFKTINPGQFISSVDLFSSNFTAFVNALEEQGDTKILSNPKLSVMNGQPALLTVGRSVTYIESIDADRENSGGISLITYSVNTAKILSGVGMSLTATVVDEGEIIMNLVPLTSELQEPIEYREVGNLGATVGLPVVNIREMSTTVKVRDGEMLVIGGLISDTEQTRGEFVPVLGQIPLVRYLFGYEEKEKRKRELIILLRPRII